MLIGVLALQGDFIEHEKMLADIGAQSRQVRLPQDLQGLDGLIIPGGESTSIGKIADRWRLLEPLQERVRQGFPVWGTCAGAILLADEVLNKSVLGQPLIGGIQIAVERNAFGRQVDSFEMDLDVPVLADYESCGSLRAFPAVFIRAPRIVRAWGQAEVLARLPEGDIVAARQGPLLATSFHPELTRDPRFHRYFLRVIAEASKVRS